VEIPPQPFPAVDSMLEKASTSGEPISKREIKAAICKTLAPFSLDDARDATDSMHAGNEGDCRWADQHASVVAAFCRKRIEARRRRSGSYHDGQRTIACRDCADYGYVTCWHPKALKALVRGDNTPGRLVACAVPCHCRPETCESK